MNGEFPQTAELLPAIVQDVRTKAVLMLGYMNRDAFEQTCATGLVTFYSRSRKQLWVKGETSGCILRCQEIKLDCDRDALLVKALPASNTCHSGAYSCFDELEGDEINFLAELERIVEERKGRAEAGSYVAKLLQNNLDKVLKKLGEELCEFVFESAKGDRSRSIEEGADLLFHFMLALNKNGIRLRELCRELTRRRLASELPEK